MVALGELRPAPPRPEAANDTEQPSATATFHPDANPSRQNAPDVMLVPVCSTPVRGNRTLWEATADDASQPDHDAQEAALRGDQAVA